MRNNFLKAAVFVVGMTFAAPLFSNAANICAEGFLNHEKTVTISSITFSQNADLHLTLNKSELKDLNKKVKELYDKKLVTGDIDSGHEFNVPELVQKLANMSIEKGGEIHEQSDRLALVSRTLDPMIKDLPLETRNLINFTFAKAMLSIEAFKDSDYVQADTIPMISKQMKYVHAGRFLTFTKSYIDHTEEYESIPVTGNGILAFKDIREIEVYNMFPVEFKGHDVRHVHYASGHPLAVGVMWASARSSVADRYALMGGLFEGVDTAQYGWERSLTSSMKSRGFDLQTAMIEIGRMPYAELRQLTAQVGAQYVVDISTQFKPSRVQQYGPQGLSGKGLDIELMDAVEEIQKGLTNKNKKYTNYDRQPPEGGATSPDDSIHY